MTLRVLDPGLYSLVVDFGRPHWRHKGVPLGGAADRTSLALGNALIGNPPESPAIEICLHGPTLTTDVPLACIVYGAPFDITVDGRRMAPNTTFTLDAGATFVVGGASVGMRAYFCVRGGLNVEPVLDSCSAFEPLRGGESFDCMPAEIHGRFYSSQLVDTLATHSDQTPMTLRFVDGPQAGWFAPDVLETAGSFEVQNDSDRMGLRLRGAPLEYEGREFVSEPVCPGTVQVTHDGQCIILGVDGQTIGGYPKIANVISADLDLLGQLRPHDTVRFVKVEMDEAVALYWKKQTILRHSVLRARESYLLAS